jgi:hypothetical protein
VDDRLPPVLIPSWLVGVFDPAHAYMERTSKARGRGRPSRQQHEHGGPSASEAVLVGTAGAPDAPREATADELRPFRAQSDSEDVDRRWEARLSEIEVLYSSFLRTKAEELIAAGVATLQLSRGEMRARIIRFRWGALVLEITRPGGTSRNRLSKPQARDVSVLATYLALALAQNQSAGELLVCSE